MGPFPFYTPCVNFTSAGGLNSKKKNTDASWLASGLGLTQAAGSEHMAKVVQGHCQQQWQEQRQQE